MFKEVVGCIDGSNIVVCGCLCGLVVLVQDGCIVGCLVSVSHISAMVDSKTAPTDVDNVWDYTA